MSDSYNVWSYLQQQQFQLIMVADSPVHLHEAVEDSASFGLVSTAGNQTGMDFRQCPQEKVEPSDEELFAFAHQERSYLHLELSVYSLYGKIVRRVRVDIIRHFQTQI